MRKNIVLAPDSLAEDAAGVSGMSVLVCKLHNLKEQNEMCCIIIWLHRVKLEFLLMFDVLSC